jgi:uncharacterized repeat protein (TIGR01451 family)
MLGAVQVLPPNGAPLADLSVTLASAASVAEGQPLAFQFAIHNAGPTDATAVALTNVLPAGVLSVTASFSQGTFLISGGILTAALGTILSGATVTGTIILTADEGFLSDVVQVSSATPDPDLSNNAASVNTLVNDPLLLGQGGFLVAAGPAAPSQLVATFTDPAQGQASSEYTASIAWGDNTTLVGQIVPDPSSDTFRVLGTHAYGAPGIYTVTVSLFQEGILNAIVTSTAVQSSPPSPLPSTLPAPHGPGPSPAPSGTPTPGLPGPPPAPSGTAAPPATMPSAGAGNPLPIAAVNPLGPVFAKPANPVGDLAFLGSGGGGNAQFTTVFMDPHSLLAPAEYGSSSTTDWTVLRDWGRAPAVLRPPENIHDTIFGDDESGDLLTPALKPVAERAFLLTALLGKADDNALNFERLIQQQGPAVRSRPYDAGGHAPAESPPVASPLHVFAPPGQSGSEAVLVRTPGPGRVGPLLVLGAAAAGAAVAAGWWCFRGWQPCRRGSAASASMDKQSYFTPRDGEGL